MTCVICKKGQTADGKTTVTLERGQAVLVIRGVPAQVCRNCGEAYVDEVVTTELLRAADEAVRAGIQVDVREYVAA